MQGCQRPERSEHCNVGMGKKNLFYDFISVWKMVTFEDVNLIRQPNMPCHLSSLVQDHFIQGVR
jgi:hypothetical protein